ncbi:MAG TPA: hypothetical protein VFB33_16895 [Candidatus Binataceae bacterium]|jgi:hypothetical protein|nr:hypothetical protein [Candidatus Binataceae bacterium]
MEGARYANIAVVLGAVMLAFVISFGFFVRLGVAPPFLLVLLTMLGVGLLAAGLLFNHDNGISRRHGATAGGK